LRNKPSDAIHLDKTGLLVLVSIIAIVFLYLIWGLAKPPKIENKGPEVDLELEIERDGVPYDVQEIRDSPPGSRQGGEMDIVIPCSIDRKPLVATIKTALSEMYISHPDHMCHKVNVYLRGSAPYFCVPVAEGYLCKEGHVVDGVIGAPWDIHIRLLARADWPDMDDRALDRLCVQLAETGTCPWKEPFDEDLATRTIMKLKTASKEEAGEIIARGKMFTSANYYYRQQLRQRH
jgi:hypothetical protein